MTNYTVKELFWFYLERLKALQALEDDIRLFLNRKITATELRQRLEKRREGLPAQKTKYMGMKKLKCKKCGSERFTGDVFYNTEIKLYEKGGFDIVSDLDAEQLDTGSIQCLECGEDFQYPFKSKKFVARDDE